MPSQQTANSASVSARAMNSPPAVTNMQNELLAQCPIRPNYSIPRKAEELARGAAVLMLDIHQRRSLLAPIEESINRIAASRPLAPGETPLAYEIVQDRAGSPWVIVEVVGAAELILALENEIRQIGFASADI